MLFAKSGNQLEVSSMAASEQDTAIDNEARRKTYV